MSKTTYKDINGSLWCFHMLSWCTVLSFCLNALQEKMEIQVNGFLMSSYSWFIISLIYHFIALRDAYLARCIKIRIYHTPKTEQHLIICIDLTN